MERRTYWDFPQTGTTTPTQSLRPVTSLFTPRHCCIESFLAAAEPPSYDSLFGRIRDTHKTSRNLVDFLVKLLILLLGTIGCTVACSVTVVIPLCMIVVGSIYFDECPAEPHIPVFLIVGGAFAVFKYLIGVMTRIRRGQDGNSGEENQRQAQPVQTLITCFLCGWFISGELIESEHYDKSSILTPQVASGSTASTGPTWTLRAWRTTTPTTATARCTSSPSG